MDDIPDSKLIDAQRNEQMPSLADVLGAVENELATRIRMSEPERLAVTLWIAHTYIYEHYNLTPRLFIRSVKRGSGKSYLGRIIATLSNKGGRSGRVTEAALVRAKTELGKVTVVCDQLDQRLTKDQRGLIDALCAGADKGLENWYAEAKGKGGFKAVTRDMFFPVVLGKIGGLPDSALLSRCIVIRMHPVPTEERAKYRRANRRSIDPSLGQTLSLVMGANKRQITTHDPELPMELEDRVLDKWEPLLAIAEIAGGDLASRAQASMMHLESQEVEAMESREEKLLRTIVRVVKDWPYTGIGAKELDDELKKKGEYTVGARRSQALIDLDVPPQKAVRSDKVRKGYLVADLMYSAKLYLRNLDEEEEEEEEHASKETIFVQEFDGEKEL